MTILEYILVGGLAAVAIRVVYRLFVGWRISTFRQDEAGTEPSDSIPPNSKLRNEIANK